MAGAMYAPSDWLTLMLMTGYVEKEMDHLVFSGPAGATPGGTFTTRSDGIADTRLSGLFRLWDHGDHHAHLTLGGSLPTGTNTERDTILTPLGTTPTVRLPYAMQIGSGTFDLLPGLTYNGRHERFGWGAQYAGTVRTGKDNGYSLGDRHQFTGWLSYQPIRALSSSIRLDYSVTGDIDGRDQRIAGPVQTADPDNYGGRELRLMFGLNWAGQSGFWRGKRIALEGGIPLHRHLNGPQMETDFVLSAGFQMAL